MDNLSSELLKYRRIVDSERNRWNISLFEDTTSIIEIKFRGIPARQKVPGDPVPFIASMGNDMVQNMFDLDMIRYYHEPLYFLEKWLQIQRFHFENIPDNNVFTEYVPLWLGEGFEATLFGCKTEWSSKCDPVVRDGFAWIQDNTDISALALPDFGRGEPMQRAKRFYRELIPLLADYGLRPAFKTWHYGPMAMALYLRGYQNFLMDILTAPEFAKEVLDYIVRAQLAWTHARNEYDLSHQVTDTVLYNDVVSGGNISPEAYEQIVIPAEQALCGPGVRVSYYHNCGPVDNFVDIIQRNLNVRMMHAGPYSDFGRVAARFGPGSAIEHHLHPERDFLHADDAWFGRLVRSLSDIRHKNNVIASVMRLSVYQSPYLEVAKVLEKVRRFIQIKNKIEGRAL